jgi:TPR repeat protein
MNAALRILSILSISVGANAAGDALHEARDLFLAGDLSGAKARVEAAVHEPAGADLLGEILAREEGADHAEAFALFERAAEGGYLPALYRVPELILKGKGVQKDPIRANRYFEKIRKRADWSGVFTESERAWLDKRVAAKDGIAALTLAKYSLEGTGAPRNVKKGAKLLRLAASKRVSFAAHQLGSMLYQGEVKANLAERLQYGPGKGAARLHFENAALAGVYASMHAMAAYRVDRWKRAGKRRVEIVKAAKWLERAVDAGDAHGKTELGILYARHAMWRRPALKVAGYLEPAAKAGSTEAQWALAEAYREAGETGKALRWWQRAAESGDTAAQVSLAKVYRDGAGVPRDPATAYSWLLIAEEAGDAGAARMARKLEDTLFKDQLAQGRRMAARIKARAAGAAAAGGTAGAAAFAESIDPKFKKPEDKNKFALIIAVEKYQNAPNADYAERDAEAVRRFVKAMGFPDRNVVVLKGSEAGYAGIKKYVEGWLPKVISPRSTLVVYFSGHGAPDPEKGTAYLLPWDGDPQFLDSTAYPLSRLMKRLGKLTAKKILVALDSCFSGAGGRSVLAKGLRPLVTKVELPGRAAKKVTVLSASAGEEVTGTLSEKQHGIFTYYLLDSLNQAGANPFGTVSVRQLYDYLSPRVSDEARRQNRSQSPSLAGSGGEWSLF